MSTPSLCSPGDVLHDRRSAFTDHSGPRCDGVAGVHRHAQPQPVGGAANDCS